MLKLAVVGKDVSRSDSPAIHKFILGAWGKACTYEQVSIPPEQFHGRAGALFAQYDAFNVTIPFKGEILPYLSELRGDAALFGAVNTVLSRERAGYNTDGYGFMLMLENAGVGVRGKRVLVLGAGGAGRSCLKKLSDAGAEVYAYGRNADRVEAVHRELGGFTPLREIVLQPYDVIINCTGVGMHATVGQTPSVVFAGGKTEPIGEQLLSLCGLAVDLIYVPAQSEFLRVAESLGKRTINGAPMLFYQAYYADCIICGRTPDGDEARSLLQKFMEERS